MLSQTLVMAAFAALTALVTFHTLVTVLLMAFTAFVTAVVMAFHAAVTALALEDVPDAVAQKIMRHKDYKTTRKYYTHIDTSDALAAANKDV